MCSTSLGYVPKTILIKKKIKSKNITIKWIKDTRYGYFTWTKTQEKKKKLWMLTTLRIKGEFSLIFELWFQRNENILYLYHAGTHKDVHLYESPSLYACLPTFTTSSCLILSVRVAYASSLSTILSEVLLHEMLDVLSDHINCHNSQCSF